MTPPLACEVSGERIPNREWVRSDRRLDNSGIRKEEDAPRISKSASSEYIVVFISIIYVIYCFRSAVIVIFVNLRV